MLLKNRSEFMIIILAVLKLGAIFITINTELKGAFLQHQSLNSEPKLNMCEAHLCDAFQNITASAGSQELTAEVAGHTPIEPPAVPTNSLIIS